MFFLAGTVGLDTSCHLPEGHLLVAHLAASTAMASPLSCNLRVLAKDEGSFAITGLLMSYTPPYCSQPRGQLGKRREDVWGDRDRRLA